MTASKATLSQFEEERSNRQRTLLFLVLGVIWIGSLGFWGTFGQLWLVQNCLEVFGEHESWHPWFERSFTWSLWGAAVGIGIWTLSVLVLLFASSQGLPKAVGAHPVAGLDETRLGRVLERLTAAAGASAAKVRLYVWENPIPNAFAAGRSLSSGSIVVTRGLLNELTDSEVEGVVAHELAHLKNRDSVYMVQATALVSLLVLVGFYGVAVTALIVAVTAAIVWLMISVIGGLASEGGGWGAIIALLVGLMLLGAIIRTIATGLTLAILCILVFGAVCLITGIGLSCAASAVSNSREYLADACAAQWTRQPDMLASALHRITDTQATTDLRGVLLLPLLFSRSSGEYDWTHPKTWLHRLLRTHPPVEHRIAVLYEIHGTGQAGVPAPDRPLPSGLDRRLSDWIGPLLASLLLAGLSVYSALNLERFTIPSNRPAPARVQSASSRLPAGVLDFGDLRDVGVINQPVVRVRKGPSTQTSIVGRLHRGATVAILQENEGWGQQKGWYRVRAGRLEGWVAKRLIDLEQPKRRGR